MPVRCCSSFGGGSPSSVAVEADGGILVTDTAAGTDPNGGTAKWGVLYRLVEEPATGQLARTTLTDFGAGPASGRGPRAVAVEADGRILVLNGNGGTSDRAVLVRIDPVTGARAILSDFGNAGQGGVGVEPRGLAIEAGGQILVIDAQAGFGGAGSAQGELVRVHPQTGADLGQQLRRGREPRSESHQRGRRGGWADPRDRRGAPEHHPARAALPDRPLERRPHDPERPQHRCEHRQGAGGRRRRGGRAILVVDKHAGALTRGMLFRVDPQTGARTILSDFNVGPNGGGDPLALAVVPHRPATLRVVDEVVNDSGGSATAGDFTVTVTGTGPSPASFAGATAPGTVVTLTAGAYSVSATGRPATTASRARTAPAPSRRGRPGRARSGTTTSPGRWSSSSTSSTTTAGARWRGTRDERVRGHPSPASFPGAGAPGTR